MDHRLPPLNALRTFEAAARHMSFKRAAEELSVTPTAVSHQIRSLEEHLGVALFRRLTRALELTPEGEVLLPRVREGMDCFADGVARVRALRPVTRLRVVAPPSFAARWLMPRLHRFSERAPHIELHLRASVKSIDDDRSARYKQEHRRERDGRETPQVWIRFGLGGYRGVREDRLFQPSFTMVCAPALLARKPLATPQDLCNFPFIHDDTVPDGGEPARWQAWLKAAGVSGVAARGPHFFDSALAFEAALDGLGVALLARELVVDEIAAERLVAPFETVIRRRFAYYVVAPEELADEPSVVAFRDWLLDEVGATVAHTG